MIAELVAVCAAKGIKELVISPGSRSAPLAVYFARHPEIRMHVVVDERSAAYIALGMAQQTENIVALVCTSGTAALNYSPAIAEAFYANIPLLVITADRPPEWIDQMDGQVIHQNGLYGAHVKRCYSLPVDTRHPDAKWQFTRQISEAINLTRAALPGPVHINIPIREPFYQTLHDLPEDLFEPDCIAPGMIHEINGKCSLDQEQWEYILHSIQQSPKIVILAGQHDYSPELISSLKALVKHTGIALLGDLLSNLQTIPAALVHIDTILNQVDQDSAENLRPDLLITYGQGILSKNVKAFFRTYAAKEHWHIQETGVVGDLLKSVTNIVRVEPKNFFHELSFGLINYQGNMDFPIHWRRLEQETLKIQENFFLENRNNYSDFVIGGRVLNSLPEESDLHLANSMTVRYASIIGVKNNNIRVYSNRGASGIDGSLSTAMGHALTTGRLQILLIGDLSFFYDSNGLWNEGIPSNLRIIVFNNHGGNIFTMIEGPQKLSECERYFITPHQRNVACLAKDFDLVYCRADNYGALSDVLDEFFENSGRAKVLELITDRKMNTKIFSSYKDRFRKFYS